MDRFSLLVTCEHAGNEVPIAFQDLFKNEGEVLNSHRGWDPGAWLLAESLGEHFKVKTIPFFNTRLLIEPNRSIDHPELFSEFSNTLSNEQKDSLIKEHYKPYRENIELSIRQMKNPVLHLSIHTFTPVFKGEIRMVDIGLLFDPERNNEKVFCEKWKKELAAFFPEWNIAFNEPYKGIDDGFTTYLRTQFSTEQYLGIELEWNQKWAVREDANHYYNFFRESLTSII